MQIFSEVDVVCFTYFILIFGNESFSYENLSMEPYLNIYSHQQPRTKRIMQNLNSTNEKTTTDENDINTNLTHYAENIHHNARRN